MVKKVNKKDRLQDKMKPPLLGRKIGERAAKGVLPPFHPKGKPITDYKS